MRRLLYAVVAGTAVLGGAFAMSVPTEAQESDTKWIRRTIKDTCLNWGYCPTRTEWVRYERPRNYRPAVHHGHHGHHGYNQGHNHRGDIYSSTYVDQGPLCLQAAVRERGEEYNTVNGAKIDAVRRWQAAVRADYGERFMDIATARNITYDCHRSSTNESWQGKAAALVGRALEKLTGDEEDAYKKRCVVVAIPCREPLRSVVAEGAHVNDARSTQEQIRELEQKGYRVVPTEQRPANANQYQPKKRWYYRYIGRERG